jgi:plastocyanin
MRLRHILVALLTIWFGLRCARAQVATVSARVEVEGAAKGGHGPSPITVVWLTAVSGGAGGRTFDAPNATLRLTQRNKSFDPHVLVVPAGAAVEFPNRDPFFHNVFSLFEGKRFDLGLYEAGTSRIVHFDRPGISYIFCNIHPEMSGVVITLNTPFYAVVNGEGQFQIPNVPYGRYLLNVWNESNGPENKQPLGREITVDEGSSKLAAIRVPAINRQSLAHKNKYGRDYDAPTPDSSVYHQQP